MYVRIIFSLVKVAEWPPFGKEKLTRLAVWFLCILFICTVSKLVPVLVLRTGFWF